MSNRIPSSLKWLVDKRRRIHSEIIHIEHKLGILLKSEQTRITKLQEDLEAVDKTIKLHEIIVNPEKISPIRIYKKKEGFRYGEITRLIYEILSKYTQRGLSTTQIVELIISKKNFNINERSEYEDLYQRVRYRLKNLYNDRKINKLKEKNKVRWFPRF